jgi:hypothetical protein
MHILNDYKYIISGLCTTSQLVQRSPTVCLYVCDQETSKREAKGAIMDYKRLWMNEYYKPLAQLSHCKFMHTMCRQLLPIKNK